MGSESLDWRNEPRELREPNMFGGNDSTSESVFKRSVKFGGFMHSNKKKTRIVVNPDGSRMKFCPGDSCRVFIPLFQFANNCNMPDGLDTYCLGCNNRKRKENDFSRFGFQAGFHLPTAIDDSLSSFPSFQPQRKDFVSVMKRDVLAAIQNSIDQTCELLGWKKMPITADVIYEKLFTGRRWLCERTNQTMTPACFLDHHAIRFMIEDNRLNIKCNGCVMP